MLEDLRSLPDHQLLTETDTIAAHDRQVTLRLLVRLREIERRKLYLKQGYSSMFIYCTSRLRMSESVAVRRLRTARCLVRFPQLGQLLESGETSACAVSSIAKYLSSENVDVLTERLRGKSRREVERIVAELEPRTMLPLDRVRTLVLPVTETARNFTATGGGKESATLEGDHERESRVFATIQFTAREEFMAKVERARALVWHQFPNPTFEQLFELGLDALIALRDPAERQKRREKRASFAGKALAKSGKRYVSAAVRDQVFARDGFRCSYVGPDGRRCTATVALQVDHVVPVARGGASRADNLRILCAEHNRFEAERLMGVRDPVTSLTRQ